MVATLLEKRHSPLFRAFMSYGLVPVVSTICAHQPRAIQQEL
jgi:hypothetical protein